MTGTQRLPGGERRKASQRHSRPAAPLQSMISRLWHPGDRVRWRDRIGVFRRDLTGEQKAGLDGQIRDLKAAGCCERDIHYEPETAPAIYHPSPRTPALRPPIRSKLRAGALATMPCTARTTASN